MFDDLARAESGVREVSELREALVVAGDALALGESTAEERSVSATQLFSALQAAKHAVFKQSDARRRSLVVNPEIRELLDEAEEVLKSLKPEGRLVLVGNVSNAAVPLPLGLCILNSLSIVGSDSIESQELCALFDFMTKHDLRPPIDRVLPLEDAMVAHRMLERGDTTGRVVLRVSDDDDADHGGW